MIKITVILNKKKNNPEIHKKGALLDKNTIIVNIVKFNPMLYP